jgi:hypothetical protein
MSPGTGDKQRSGGAGKTSAETSAPNEPGVLTSLPSTRPQRASARRAGARRPTAGRPVPGRAANASEAGGTSAERPAKSRPRGTTKAPPKTARVPPKTAGIPSRPPEPPVPRQGFEAEEDIKPGVPVQPPGNAELAASAVELVGELAQAGLSAGGRLLKEALARLPGI